LRIIYLLVVVIGAIVLWLLVPGDVKNAIRETYFSGSPATSHASRTAP